MNAERISHGHYERDRVVYSKCGELHIQKLRTGPGSALGRKSVMLCISINVDLWVWQPAGQTRNRNGVTEHIFQKMDEDKNQSLLICKS